MSMLQSSSVIPAKVDSSASLDAATTRCASEHVDASWPLFEQLVQMVVASLQSFFICPRSLQYKQRVTPPMMVISTLLSSILS